MKLLPKTEKINKNLDKSEAEVFYRRAKRLGNSAGVLLPKHLLGADVKVTIIKKPVDILSIKNEAVKNLEPFFEELLGIYLIKNEKHYGKQNEKNCEILAISKKAKEAINKDNYRIDIVPLDVIKKAVKEKKTIRDKISRAGTIFNSSLLDELKKI